MSQFFSNLTIIVILLGLLAFFVFTGFRVGPGFLVKRLAGLIFVLLGVTFITFLLVYIGAGPDGAGVVLNQCGQHCTDAVVRNLENFYHLRDPWYQQYGTFLNRLVHFDLGYSFQSRSRTVWDILRSGVPISVQLQLMNYTVVLLVGVPIGIFAALRAGTQFDTLSSGISLLFYAIPTFLLVVFFQIVTVFLAKHQLPHLPPAGWEGPFSIYAIGPVTVLALVTTAYYLRLTRTSMLEVLHQDYIRTARAKGLQERAVVFKHGFRNAMIPLVTALGPALALSVSGAFFTESGFNIPGIGLITVGAIAQRDLPVVQGTVVIAATAVVVMNLVADVVYGILDPRIKVV
jgi:peptide/nickel transport system permease protein/oligopeptide transport system permease protein